MSDGGPTGGVPTHRGVCVGGLPVQASDARSVEVMSLHPLIVNRLDRLWQRLPVSVRRRVDRQELYAAGLVGAWAAVRRMAGRTVLRPSAWAAAFIRNAMIDWLRESGLWLSNGASRNRFSQERQASERDAVVLRRRAVAWIGYDVLDGQLVFDELAERAEGQEGEVLRLVYRAGLSVQEAAIRLGVSVTAAERLVDRLIEWARNVYHVEGTVGQALAVRDLAERLGWSKAQERQRRARYNRAYRQLPHVREARRREKERARRRKGIQIRADYLASAAASRAAVAV